MTLFAGVPYEYAAVAPEARLVFTAGACPLDDHGRVVAPGDYEEQARQSLNNLVAVLEAQGSMLDEVVKTTVFVVGGREDLVRVWNVVAKRFAPARPPSTLLGVATLGYPDQLVEIEAVARLAAGCQPGFPLAPRSARTASAEATGANLPG